MAERTAKDYAIEHGGYLATAAERLLHLVRVLNGDELDLDEDRAEDMRQRLDSVRDAIHEFRKRAYKAI